MAKSLEWDRETSKLKLVDQTRVNKESVKYLYGIDLDTRAKEVLYLIGHETFIGKRKFDFITDNLEVKPEKTTSGSKWNFDDGSSIVCIDGFSHSVGMSESEKEELYEYILENKDFVKFLPKLVYEMMEVVKKGDR